MARALFSAANNSANQSREKRQGKRGKCSRCFQLRALVHVKPFKCCAECRGLLNERIGQGLLRHHNRRLIARIRELYPIEDQPS